MTPKEIVLNNIIGLNPTGTLNFSDTYTMMGNNSIVLDSTTASENNLKKASENEIVCNSIENFDNYENKRNNKTLILIILFLIILLILYFFINK